MSEFNSLDDSVLPQVWRDWIEGNLRKGCTQQSMIEPMVQANFKAEIAAKYIASTADSISKSEFPRSLPIKPYRYDNSRIALGNTIALSDRLIKVALRLTRPDVVLFTGFMSDGECEELIDYAKHKLFRSTIVDPKSGDMHTINDRTSEGAYFQRGENELVQRLEKRISELMNWPIDHGEGMQVLNYKVGAEYQPHFDYFPPQDPGSLPHLALGGQRVATLVMYLNDAPSGGETVFPDTGLSVSPQRGSAVYFSYVNSHGQVDPATLHAGAPVLEGEKWIATKWMRQRQYGG